MYKPTFFSFKKMYKPTVKELVTQRSTTPNYMIGEGYKHLAT